MSQQLLSLADICKLQYELLAQEGEKKQNKPTLQENSSPIDNQRIMREKLMMNYHHHELIRIDLSRGGRSVKPFYENDIDPIEYLRSGELVLFPNKKQFIISEGNELVMIKSEKENNETLTLSDLIEYYRLFPNFNWSRYPHLYDWIMNNLTMEEHESVLKLMNEYKSFHQKEKQFMTDYRKFVSQFSLTDWFSEMFDYFFSSSTRLNKSEKTRQELNSKTRQESSKLISKEFLQYIFPYVGLLGLLWLIRQLFQLLKR